MREFIVRNPYNTKGDDYHKSILNTLLRIGTYDKNPRPKYKDGTPAHALSYNGDMLSYDLSVDSPLITLRPIAWKSAIGELLWIYQDASNDLDLLASKYNIHWWDNWDIGNRTIGSCYGYTVKKHNLMEKLLEDIINNPDGRRHIISLWQDEDFETPHALKPCCYLTMWNVRHTNSGDYLDMTLIIRSSDYATAGCINSIQYAVFLTLVARHCNYLPGNFNIFIQNIQIYNRHIDAVKELISRESIPCNPKIVLNPDKKDFYSFTLDDIKIEGYPIEEIKKENPQITIFRDEIAI